MGVFVLTLAVLQFRRSTALVIASSAAMAALAFLLAYLKVRNYT